MKTYKVEAIILLISVIIIFILFFIGLFTSINTYIRKNEIIKEFCLENGWNHSSTEINCYKIENDTFITKEIIKIGDDVYWEDKKWK